MHYAFLNCPFINNNVKTEDFQLENGLLIKNDDLFYIFDRNIKQIIILDNVIAFEETVFVHINPITKVFYS